jgi:tetratricopeptide (TPR) repeat protein
MKRLLLVLIILNFFFSEGWTQDKNERYVNLFASGNFQQLIIEGQREISNSPNNEIAHYYLGRAFLETGEFKLAVDHLKKACEFKPGSDNHYHLAIAYGNYAETVNPLKQPFIIKDMIGALKKSVDLDLNHIEAKFLLSKFYATAPSFLGGDLAMARKYAIELRSIKNDYSNLIEAYIFIKEDNILKAEDRLLKVLEINPSLEDAYDKLNSIYTSKEEKFPVYLQHVINQHPESPYPLYHLALSQVDHHQYKEARENFLKALSNDSEFMRAYYQAGKLSVITQSGYEDGIIFLKKYLSKPVYKNGLFPSHADAHWRIGMIYEKLKIKSKAIDHYQSAIALDPGHEAAKTALRA